MQHDVNIVCNSPRHSTGKQAAHYAKDGGMTAVATYDNVFLPTKLSITVRTPEHLPIHTMSAFNAELSRASLRAAIHSKNDQEPDTRNKTINQPNALVVQ